MIRLLMASPSESLARLEVFFIKTVFVDDEIWMMQHFRDVCENVDDIEIIGAFRNPLEALDFARGTSIDLAFLDMEMPQMSGQTLAVELRALYPNIIIIFVTAHDQYMSEAFRSRMADYFILKPYTHEDVTEVLARARLLSRRLKKRVSIQTFGRFEVFVDEKPLYFSNAKAKELLALLVDRDGGRVDSAEAFSLLWEDKPYSHAQAASYRHALKDLLRTLEEANADDILLRLPRGCAIKKDVVDCDYFDFLENQTDAVRRYAGEYMSNYSWGEFRIAALNGRKNNLLI